ncbi:MAG TPA: hypothetical protein VJJ75_00435 [Candidatus Nanoarchaeia archaeon]|nr:hypothetical protein [Candidatus Nanoarchaeia archaeon]
MLKKRGITPLIATVILVGFAIVILTLVLLWGTKYVRDLQEKEGEIAATKLSCSTGVGIALLSAELIGLDISIQVENTKEQIDGLYVVARGSAGQETMEVAEEIGPGEVKTIRVSYDSARVGTAEEVDVIPRLAVAPGIYESCSGQHEVYELEE